MTPKDDKEYLAQGELYFSESAGQFVRIEEMIPQYAANCFKKMRREYGPNFTGSGLAIALMAKLVPSTQQLRADIHKHGKAVIWLGTAEPGMGNPSKWRARLRQAGAHSTKREGEFLAGFAEPVSVKVKGKVVA